jgi:hypothetical protein
MPSVLEGMLQALQDGLSISCGSLLVTHGAYLLCMPHGAVYIYGVYGYEI